LSMPRNKQKRPNAWNANLDDFNWHVIKDVSEDFYLWQNILSKMWEHLRLISFPYSESMRTSLFRIECSANFHLPCLSISSWLLVVMILTGCKSHLYFHVGKSRGFFFFASFLIMLLLIGIKTSISKHIPL
jgi:hypothetical protein